MYPERAGLESPAMADDDGVLGNLPRSRPGKRSEKRDSGGRPSNAARKAAARAEAGGTPAAKAPRASKPRTRAKPAASAKPGRGAAGAGARSQRAATGARSAQRQPGDPPRPQPSGDVVTTVVRTAATVAATGVRVAGAFTQEILRRLPRR
jgi:hypothetical protein